MSKTMTYDEMAAELARQQNAKHDFVQDTRKVGFKTEDGVSFLWADDDEPPTPDGYPVNDHAHGQIAARLGIPKKYYDRMRVEAPQLLDRNVAHWLTAKPERRLFRCMDGKLRAVLSDRYRRIDNFDVMVRSVMPVFADTPGLEFQQSWISETRLYVHALLPRLQAEIKVGDLVQAGVLFRNSEVGAGALVAEPRVLRLICMNGMTVPAFAMRKYHVGRRIEDENPVEDALDVYSEETLRADDEALFLKVRDVVKAALDEAKFQDIVARLRETVDTAPAVQPIKAIEHLAQRFQLREDEAENALLSFIKDGDFTQWGAANAITRAAQDADDLERQIEMEAIGGEVVALDVRQWEAVAATR